MLSLSSLQSVCSWISVDGFKAYENEDDVTKDLAEFSLANAIFAALTEGYACEQSARYVSIVPGCYKLVIVYA